MAGQAGGSGRYRSSAASTWVRTSVRKSASASVTVQQGSAAGRFVLAERRRRGLELAALVEQLDAPLRRFEACVAILRELDAARVQLERLLEREVAFLELLHD